MLVGWKRMLSVALAMIIALSVAPLGAVRAETATAAYGKVTDDKVYLRKEPDKKAEYWFQMNTNHVAEILDTVTKNGAVWYHVQSENPASDGGHTYIGYIMAEFFRPLTAEETQRWLSTHSLDANATVPPSGTATPVPGMTGNRLGEITAGETNFRVAAGMSGGIIAKLDRGTIVELLSIPVTTTSSDWYRVRYDGREGYINAPYIRVLDVGTSGDLAGLTIYGYVQLTETSANLRLTPGGDVDVQWTVKGEVLPYVSAPRQDTSNAEWRWYEVVYGGKRLWVRSDCVKRVASGQTSTTTNAPATNAPATNTPSTVTTPPAPTSGYVVTTQDRVLLRLQPFGEKVTRVEKKGTVLPYELVVQPYTTGNNSKYTWYYVTVTENGAAVKGYIRSDCVEITSAPSETTAPTVTDTPAPPTAPATVAPADFGYVKMIKTDVALRQTPGGTKLERLALGTVVPVTGATLQASSYTWYPVRAASGNAGFVRGDCVAACDAAGNIGGTATQAPATVTPSVPTNTPGSSYTGYGYVQIILDKTNIRSSMNGPRILQIPTKGGIYPLWGNPGSKGGYNWYPILIDGQQAWVRSDCVHQLTQEQVDAYLNGQTLPTDQPATEPPATSTYLITVLDNVNLRDSASKDSNASFNVPVGTVMAYNGSSGSGNNVWYRVIYRNKEVWVLGSCVRVMTQQEYQDWQTQHPNDDPQTEVILGYVKTTAGKVNLRKQPDGDRIWQIQDAGTVLPYTATEVVRNTTWYYVMLVDGTRGWITGDYVTLTDANGNSTATSPSTPTTTPAPGTYVPPTAGQEATYTTLSYGDSGDAVTRLVTELKLQGYYSGEITSRYSSAVRDAVKAFQQAKGLTVDGIANSATQHALFQTVPVGSGTSGGLDFPLYPVEKIDWFTGGIQELWPKGANAKVYDVRTGIVWWAHRWSGYNHADVETLTAADTARLCRILGVTTMDVVTDKSSDGFWRKRPIVVQIGTRNFAASLYAVPHNPEGDTIPNNNMTGQICIHFTNSRTSGTNVVLAEHTEAIEYAYTHFPGGHK